MTRTAAWLGLIAFALVAWLAVFRTLGFDPTVSGSDAWNYLAAGERLNAGHPLYQLSPGDRAITLLPPYWSVPLLAPPPIAVLWRPLALLGDSSMIVWATAGLATTLVTAGWLLARGGLVAAGIVALFAVPLAIQSLAGNANAFLFLALVLAWVWRDRPPIVGSFVAAAIAVKLTPVLLVIWLASVPRRRAVAMVFVALGVIGVLSLLGAGLQSHLDWLRSLPGTVPAPTSIAGITGLPSWVILGVAVGAVGLAALRRDERLTFSVAVIAAAPWVGEGRSVVASLRGRALGTEPT